MTTSDKLDDWFWGLVGEHVHRREDGSIDAEPLLAELKRLSPDQIREFDRIFYDRFFESRSEKLWGAADVILDGAPESTFDDFRCWLIGCGRDVYIAAVTDPESLVDIATKYSIDEEMASVGHWAYEAVTGNELVREPRQLPKLPQTIDFLDRDLMSKLFPRLCQKFPQGQFASDELLPGIEALMARVREYADENELLNSNPKGGFFNRFRPFGEGIQELFAGLEFGDEIADRLIAAMRIDGSPEPGQLRVNRPIAIDGDTARELFLTGCSRLRQLAESESVGMDDVSQLLDIQRVAVFTRSGTKFESNSLTDTAQLELGFLGLQAVESNHVTTLAVGILSRAIQFLAGYDPLAYYILWPPCEGRYLVSDPFEPFYQLWRCGAEWRLNEGGTAEVYLP